MDGIRKRNETGKRRIALKKLVGRSDGDAVTVVGTYKDKQLAWIKKHGVYNYPVKEEDELKPESCTKVKELWLYASAKGKRHCFAADFVGIQSKDEFLAANPTYAKFGPNKHAKYMVFKTTVLDYGPRLEGATVFARVSDFEKGRGRTKKIAAAIKRFHADGDFGLLADYLPGDLAKLPREQLRVCEAAVQMDFIFTYGKSNQMNKTQKKVISLFSGAGGLDIGFGKAGFETSVLVEIDHACCRTLRANLPGVPLIEGDLNNVSTSKILDTAGLKPLEAALVIGGPPCQSFSLAGKRMGLEDPRGRLVLEFIRVVREALPVGFVMENVKGLVNWAGGKALDAIIAEATEPIMFRGRQYRYKVSYKVLNAAEYGVPQFRERIFIVGNRIDCDFEFPAKKFGPVANQEKLKPYRTVRDAICDLPEATPPSETALRVSECIKGRIEKHGY